MNKDTNKTLCKEADIKSGRITKGKKQPELVGRLRKLERNIRLDYLYTFIRNLDMSSSIWVLYLAYRGMSLLEIGLLEGIFHVTGMLFEVPSGAVADLFGRKKTVVAGRVLLTISCVIMLLSTSFWGFALGFIVQALSYNLNSGSEEALVYDSLKLCGREEEYLKINGRLNVLMEVSQAIATVAGGILAEYSYTWCYVACIVIALLGLLPAVLMVEPDVEKTEGEQEAEQLKIGIKPEGNELQKDEAEMRMVINAEGKLGTRIRRHFQSSLDVLRNNKAIRSIVVYYSVIFAAYTLLFFYSQQYFADLGLNKVQISVIMLFAGGLSCLGALGSEKLYAWWKEKCGRYGAVVIALCIVAFGLRKLPVAVGALLLSSFFNSVLYPIQSNALNKLIPSEQRATLISVNSMAFSVAMILFFPAVGALADCFGLARVFLGLGVILVVGVVGATNKV